MCTKCLPLPEVDSGEEFAEKLVAHYNGAAITLMISIGHRTGLFDRMSGMPPATPEAIAEEGGYNARYVREWLGAMTTAGITFYDPDSGTYELPEEHARALTRAAKPNNLAVTATFIPVLGTVEDRIIQCFREGGGLRYAEYPRFHEVMAEESEQTVVVPLTEQILPLAPEILGKLRRGVSVLDLGCGQGRALIKLAGLFPRSVFTGYDIGEDAIRSARERSAHLPNIRFECLDAASLDEREAYDVVFTFDSVHDQAKPARVLGNIHRALKPDGIYLMQDIAGSSRVENNLDHPLAPFLYTISCIHCMSVSLAEGGDGLGAMWGEELAEEMVRAAGFTRFEKRTLEHDPMNNFYIIRK